MQTPWVRIARRVVLVKGTRKSQPQLAEGLPEVVVLEEACSGMVEVTPAKHHRECRECHSSHPSKN